MKLKALLALASALLLSGCATIPQSGPVNVGQDVSSGLNSDEVYYSQSGPYTDATPDAIVFGFLSAGNGPQNDYAVAREYLTPSLAGTWQPNQEILIQDGIPELSKLSENEYQVAISVAATIDQDGHYLEELVGTKRVLNYRLAKVGTQWRITEAPNLTTINRSNFSVLFHQYSLYFFEPSLTYLVPDVRWFPSRVSTATRLMNALLKGPSDWLRPAVVNVIPSGTKLNINSVTVTDGVAAVDLSATALKVPASQKPLIKSQILATMEQVPDVTGVEISIQRTPQDIAMQGDARPAIFGDQPVILNSQGLFKIVGDGLQNVSATRDKLAGKRGTDFAYSEKDSKLAVTTPSGVQLYTLGAFDDEGKLVDARARQLSPSFDVRGALWTLSSSPGAPFVVSGQSRKVVANNWVTGTPVGFSLSPEGSRIAVSLKQGKTYRSYVFPIERDKAGEVVALGAPVALPGFASSAVWSDDVNLVLLEGDDISILTLGGRSLLSKTLSGVVAVTATGAGQIYALLESGSVMQNSGRSWLEIAADVKALHLAKR